MELLVRSKNDGWGNKLLRNFPDLRCSIYLAYPEFDKCVEEESDVQLIFCIRELYDYVYNRKRYTEFGKRPCEGRIRSVNSVNNDNDCPFKDVNCSEYETDDNQCIETKRDNILNVSNVDNDNLENKGKTRSGVQEFLDFVGDISSIISVCLETRLDINQEEAVFHRQIQRLKEQERNIIRIREYTEGNVKLSNLVEKVSNSIQYKLYCLIKMCNDYSINMHDDVNVESDSHLTPLRIKYPYLTGTYIQLGETGDCYNIHDRISAKDNAFGNSSLLLSNLNSVYENNKFNANNISNNIGSSIFKSDEIGLHLGGDVDNLESDCINRLIDSIELRARSKLKSNKRNNIGLNRGNVELCSGFTETNGPVQCFKTRNSEASLYEQRKEEPVVENNEVMIDKLVGGATRIINKMCNNLTDIQIDGWGLIKQNLDKDHKEDIISTNRDLRNVYKNDCKMVVIDRRNKVANRLKKVGLCNDRDDGDTKNQKNQVGGASGYRCDSANASGSLKESSGYGSIEGLNVSGSSKGKNNVGRIKSVFEKESINKNSIIHSSDEFETGNDKTTNTKRTTCRDSLVKACKKSSCRVGSSSYVPPSQGVNGVTTGTSTRQQLLNYRETMYSTSSWLPLSRNTGFNFDWLNSSSNIRGGERQSGSEYNPAAEYARFSDAVGKVVHPIVADESYRNNGKNVMSPKKLFNAKFGTLTVDNFKEIQEQLRLKTEGWTIHGSGLQDPRADLFWDPAVMTAASTASPFHTNIPSSNSPLLINTLIPSNGLSYKRINNNIELPNSSSSPSYSSILSGEANDNYQNYKPSVQSREEYERGCRRISDHNSAIKNRYSQNPISSMRDLYRKRNK